MQLKLTENLMSDNECQLEDLKKNWMQLRDCLPLSKKNKLMRGWRLFKCHDCALKWELPSRDCTSPSGESCPLCNGCEFPYERRIDEKLIVDSMGNLLEEHLPRLINARIDYESGYAVIITTKKVKLPLNFKCLND
jgi:hypothetical protein